MKTCNKEELSKADKFALCTQDAQNWYMVAVQYILRPFLVNVQVDDLMKIYYNILLGKLSQNPNFIKSRMTGWDFQSLDYPNTPTRKGVFRTAKSLFHMEHTKNAWSVMQISDFKQWWRLHHKLQKNECKPQLEQMIWNRWNSNELGQMGEKNRWWAMFGNNEWWQNTLVQVLVTHKLDSIWKVSQTSQQEENTILTPCLDSSLCYTIWANHFLRIVAGHGQFNIFTYLI